MALKDKLKELRLSHNMTQEDVSIYLGVSSQTVSKWERGLLSPDISLLPKIALLYRCSIDSIFDNGIFSGEEHRKNFTKKVRELHSKKDYEGAYNEYIREIDLNSDQFSRYTELMLYVIQRKMFDDNHIKPIISLAERAEKYCTDDDIRNEVYRLMVQITSQAENPEIKAKSKVFYNKLPLLRHSREVYAKYALEKEEYYDQVKKNLIYLIDLAECSVRQLVHPDMTPEEKIFYYEKSAALYSNILDDKYGGFYDVPLLSDYANIIMLSLEANMINHADIYLKKFEAVLNRHLSNLERETSSQLLYSTIVPNITSAERLILTLFDDILKSEILEVYHDSFFRMFENYKTFLNETYKK